MTIHRLGSLSSLGTTPPVKRMPADPPAVPEGEKPIITDCFPNNPAKKPVPLAKLDQMVNKAHAACLESDWSPESQQAYLKATLKAVAGYEKAAPHSPKCHEYCRLAVDLATELEWQAKGAPVAELKAVKRAAQYAYAQPETADQKERALALLFQVGQILSRNERPNPTDAKTLRFPSDDGGQMPQVEAKTMAFPSDDGGQMPQVEAKTLAFPSDDGGQMPQVEAKTLAFPSDDGGQMPQIEARTMRFPSDDGTQMAQVEAKTMRFPSDDGGQMPPIDNEVTLL